MTKPMRISHTAYEYRGFTITRNYLSPSGTFRVCETQKGWRVTPGGKAGGDWEPSLKDAADRVDYFYGGFFELSPQGKWIVIQAIRGIQKRRNDARRAAAT